VTDGSVLLLQKTAMPRTWYKWITDANTSIGAGRETHSKSKMRLFTNTTHHTKMFVFPLFATDTFGFSSSELCICRSTSYVSNDTEHRVQTV
jgi:hypothetical protein